MARSNTPDGLHDADERRTVAAGTETLWNVDAGGGQSLRMRVTPSTAAAQHRLLAVVYRPGADGASPGMVPFDADGNARYDGPRSEAVDVVFAVLPGGSSIVQLAARRGVPARETELVLELGDALPARSIRGRLVDNRRAAVAGATVSAHKTSADGLIVHVEATTAADGTFAIGPLPPGQYEVAFATVGGVQPLGAATLTAGRDEDLGDLVGGGR